MTDSRFKFLVVSVCVTLIAIVALWRFSEPKLYQGSTSTKIGKYAYVAAEALQLRNGKYNHNEIGKFTLHTSGKCKNLNHSKVIESHRVKISEIKDVSGYEICPNCVSDKQYEQLKGDYRRRNHVWDFDDNCHAPHIMLDGEEGGKKSN